MRAGADAQATKRSGDLIGVMAGARRERWDGKRLCRANTKVTESLKESSRTLSGLSQLLKLPPRIVLFGAQPRNVILEADSRLGVELIRPRGHPVYSRVHRVLSGVPQFLVVRNYLVGLGMEFFRRSLHLFPVRLYSGPVPLPIGLRRSLYFLELCVIRVSFSPQT